MNLSFEIIDHSSHAPDAMEYFRYNDYFLWTNIIYNIIPYDGYERNIKRT